MKTFYKRISQLPETVKFFQVATRCLLVFTLLIFADVLIAQVNEEIESVYTEPLVLNLKQALKLGEIEDWGIQAEMTGPDGYVEVEVLALPANPPEGEIPENDYRSILLISSNTDDPQNYHRDTRYVYDVDDQEIAESFELAMLDKDIHNKFLSDVIQPDKILEWKTDQYKRALMRAYGWQKGFVSVNTDPDLRVVLKITTQDALLRKVKIPGMEEFVSDHLAVYGYADRSLVNTYSLNDLSSLDLHVGDSVVFRTNDPSFTVDGLKDVWLARFSGESKYYHVDQRMGGFKPFIGFDSQVHGIAMRPHPDPDHMQYPTLELVTGEEDSYYFYWIAKGNLKSGLSPDDYDPTSSVNGNVAFEKFKEASRFNLPDGFPVHGRPRQQKQRNNQKEGLNMELMKGWVPEGAEFSYDVVSQNYDEFINYSYSGEADQIVLGLDDDEILMLENAVNPSNPVGNRDFIQKSTDDWKMLLEGETGDPVDVVLTYYMRNRMNQLENDDETAFNKWHLRYGNLPGLRVSELFDQEQYQYDPEIAANKAYFNFKRPLVFNDQTTGNIPIEGRVCIFGMDGAGELVEQNSFDLNVSLPGTGLETKPFYSIIGESSPAAFEKQVPYTIDLSSLPTEFKQKLTMEYTFEGHLGHLETVSRPFSNGSDGEQWTEYFDIKGSGYHEITVYYQFTPNSEKVIIAGKELLEIQLRFLSVPAGPDGVNPDGTPRPNTGHEDFFKDGQKPPGLLLDEGRGEGNFWYLRDFRHNFKDVVAGLFPEEIGRTKAFPYVFAQGDEVTFNIMDADPHTFLHYNVDFYLSERFMSKRLDDAKLMSDIHWHLSASPSDDGPSIGSGRHLTHTFNNSGTYYLTAKYRGAHHVKAQVIVKSQNYAYDKTNDQANTAEKPLGNIHTRMLTGEEKDWLQEWAAAVNGGTTPNLENIRLAEVGEVYSMFTYNDGPRAQEGINGMSPFKPSKGVFEKNRYGPQNDFNSNFEWAKSDGFMYDDQSILSLSSNDLTQLAEPYENWFPSSWILHYMPGPDPKLISDIPGYHIETNESNINTLVKGYFDGHTTIEPWQVRLPWVSQTQWKGYRTRTNIKTLNKLKALFDNDNGAFSGEAYGLHEPGTYEQFVQQTNNIVPELNDVEKDAYDFYWGIQSGRLKLVHKDDLQNGTLTVKVKNPNTPTVPTTFIAKYNTPGVVPADWMAGVDMSSIPNMEAKGIQWGVNEAQNPYELASDFGVNTVRFRLWVNPKYEQISSSDPVSKVGQDYPFSALNAVQDEIVDAKQQGLKVLLDLHLSDTWTDPNQNIIPEAWKVAGAVPDVTTLESTVSNYVQSVLTTLQGSNALPDYIQIGNETNSNILLSAPYAELSIDQLANEIGVTVTKMNSNKFTINWDRNARILNAGLSAVHSFTTANSLPRIKTMVHIAGIADAQWWIGQALSTTGRQGIGTTTLNFADLDMLGVSYYPALESESTQDVTTIIGDIYDTHNLPVVLAETAYPQVSDYSDNTANIQGAGQGSVPAETSPATQRAWLSNLLTELNQTDGSLGLVYWGPFWVGSNNQAEPMQNTTGSTWEHMGFFKFESGKPNEGLNLLEKEGGLLAFCGDNCPDVKPEVTATEIAILGNHSCNGLTGASQMTDFIQNNSPGLIVSAGNDTDQHQGNACGPAFADNMGSYFNYMMTKSRYIGVPGNKDYEDGVGNHIGLAGEQAWKDYFGLPARIYTYKSGDLEFFMINTNNRLGAGTDTADPVDDVNLQAIMYELEARLAYSTTKFKVIVGHHSPYLTRYGSSVLQNYDFKSWGADLYISSGADFYERHEVNGFNYVNIGLGGQGIDNADYSGEYLPSMVPGTHYGDNYGVLMAKVVENNIAFQFKTIDGVKRDQFFLVESLDPAGRVETYHLENRRGTAISSDNEAMEVYLLLGQSNAEGRCLSKLCYQEFSVDENQELANTYLLNEKGTFEQARNAFARYSSVGKRPIIGSVSFGWSFAQKLNDAGRTIGMIVNPVGGVETPAWMPDYVPSASEMTSYGNFSVGYGGGNLYQENKRRVEAALAKYPNAVLKGIIWSQGESDALQINEGNLDYATVTAQLFQHFRDDFNAPDLEFYLPEAAHRQGLPDDRPQDWSHTALNQQIHQLADGDPRVFVANTGDMNTFDNWVDGEYYQNSGVHWDHDSYITIGERLAALVLPEARAMVSVEENMSDDPISAAWNMRIYPNPVTDERLNIQLEIPEEGTYYMTIIGLDGKQIIDTSLWLNQGTNHTILSVKALPSGTYLLRVTGGSINFSERLVITH